MAQELLIVVEAVVRPDARARLLAAVPAFVQRTRAEPGCLAYAFLTDLLAPERVATIERWRSQADADAHMAAPHTRAVLAIAEDCLAAPPVFTTRPL